MRRAAALVRAALTHARAHPNRAALIGSGVVVVGLTMVLLRGKSAHDSYADVFALWALGNLAFVAAFARAPSGDLRAWVDRNRWELIGVAALTGLAAALRLIALGDIPEILAGDEGVIGEMAKAVLKGDLRNPFATIRGHSTMYILAMATGMKYAGVNPFGLRITSAIGGTLTVPVLYLLSRSMFGARVAVVAATLLATSHFHLHFSRIIVAGGIQDALFATVAFYFLFMGMNKRDALRMVLAGVVIGLHLYVYMGGRLLIAVVPAVVGVLWLVDRERLRGSAGPLCAFAGALVLMSAPMALWAFQHPADFMARANQVGVIQSGWLVEEARRTGRGEVALFCELLLQAFLSVSYLPAVAFYGSSLPMLDRLSGAVFVVGLAYSIWHVTDWRHLLINAWFWSGVVVGGALVVLPGLSAYRILIVFPAVCIAVGLGWDCILSLVGHMRARHGGAVCIGTALFVALVATLNVKAYFVDWVPSCGYPDWSTRFASRMGAYLGELGMGYAAYLFGAPRIYYGVHKSVDFLSGGVAVMDVREPLTEPPAFVDPKRPAVFIFIPERETELRLVQRAMPGGQVLRLKDCGNPMVVIYRAEGRPVAVTPAAAAADAAPPAGR